MIAGMPEPVTVWKVVLRRGDVREREGTLSLDDDALVFEEPATASRTRMAFSAIRSVKRLRGSPVLMIAHVESDEVVRTAFYFAQPPPLELSTRAPGGASERQIGPIAASRRSSRRRHQRDNVRYLTARAGRMKGPIDAWVMEIRARAGR